MCYIRVGQCATLWNRRYVPMVVMRSKYGARPVFFYFTVDSLYSMIFQWILAIGPTKLCIISEIRYKNVLHAQKFIRNSIRKIWSNYSV